MGLKNIRGLVFGVMCIFFANVEANDKRVTKLPNFPYTDNSEDLARGFRYVQINKDELIYIGYRNSNDAYQKFIHRYNIKERTSVEIFSISPVSNITNRTSFFVDDGRVFILTDGNLFVSDGTSVGTRLLARFGTTECCNVSTVLGNTRNEVVIDGVLYFSVYSDIVGEQYYETPSSESLWRSDGTPQGTYQLSKKHHFPPSFLTAIQGHAFKNRYLGSNAIFYFAEGDLWKVTSRGRSELFIDRGANFTVTSNVFTLAKGTFFCASDSGYNVAESNLWRLSNSGVLEVIANGCSNLMVFGDKLIFDSEGGLLYSDGTQLGERMIYARATPYKYGGVSSCVNGDYLYRTVTFSRECKPNCVSAMI